MTRQPKSECEEGQNLVPYVPWLVLWLLSATVAAVLLAADLRTPNWKHILGRDFSNLWEAGRLSLAGNASCVLDLTCFRVHQFDDLGLLANQNYSYPPHALFISIPFGWLPYYAALALWTAAGIIFFNWCSRSFLPSKFPTWLPAMTAAGSINVWNGHYGFLFGGLWLLCFKHVEKNPARSGVLAGLLTFKPHLGIMIAATIVRRPKALLATIATTIAAVAASALAFGFDTWRSFFLVTTGAQAHILTRMTPDVYFRMMPSPYVAFGRGVLGIGFQVLFAASAIWLLWRFRKWDAFTAATATFLIVPYCFNYDMTVVCLGLALLMWSEWETLSLFERVGIGLAFLSPELTFFVPPLVPLALLYALSIQLKFVARRKISPLQSGSPFQGQRFSSEGLIASVETSS